MSETGKIRFVEEVGSTNADLADKVRSDHPPEEGDWLVARRQTAGRGRQGRVWQDGLGNFMGSTVVAIRDGDPPPASLGFAAALAVVSAIDRNTALAERVRTKWPNDILIDGAKVAGLLLEMVGRTVIIGVGVNLTSAPVLPNRRTASIADYTAAPLLETFAEDLAGHLAAELSVWRRDGLAPVLRRFMERSIHSHGSAISVHDSDGSRMTGTFAGLDPQDGALQLSLADGSSRVIRAGDIV